MGDLRPPWRAKIEKDLMDSLSRRRKYPSDSAAWFVRFFRNLDQHFHDQTDLGLLCLKPFYATSDVETQNNLSDDDFLQRIRSNSTTQREAISSYICKKFPTFFLSA